MMKVTFTLFFLMVFLSVFGIMMLLTLFIGADTYTCKIDRIDGEFTTQMKVIGVNRMEFQRNGKTYFFEIRDMECSPND